MSGLNFIEDTPDINDQLEDKPSYDRSVEMDLWTKGYGTKFKDRKAQGDLLKRLDPLVKKFVSKFKSNIPPEVLRGKAFSIIHTALPAYDSSKAQMNTYLTHQLQQLHRTVAENADIGYIPEQRQLKISTYKNVLEGMRDKLDREPSTHELAKSLRWGLPEVERLRKELRGSLLEDTAISTPFEERNTDMDAITFVYDDLEPQSQVVMEHIMGLHGHDAKTLDHVAKISKLTVDQVRHVKTKIKKKLDQFYGDYKPMEMDLPEPVTANLPPPEAPFTAIPEPKMPEPPKLASVNVAGILSSMFKR